MRDLTDLFAAIAAAKESGHGDLLGLIDELIEKTGVTGSDQRVCVARWSSKNGECYDCGLPAAYVADPETWNQRLCSVCAAMHAAHGERLVYLFESDYA